MKKKYIICEVEFLNFDYETVLKLPVYSSDIQQEDKTLTYDELCDKVICYVTDYIQENCSYSYSTVEEDRMLYECFLFDVLIDTFVHTLEEEQEILELLCFNTIFLMTDFNYCMQ